METVQSKDGTTIAYDKSGSGPAVILVSGALGVRAHPMFAELSQLLAGDFTVYNYDRRGRGDSGDTLPYAPEREIEDIEALIDAAGGTAYLYGISSGAGLALEAAATLPHKVAKLALYEPPYLVDDSHPPLPDDYLTQMRDLPAAGHRGEAVELFMRVVGVPEEYLPMMKAEPSWAEMEKVAHTLAYDGSYMFEHMRGNPLRTEQWQSAAMPTLVMVGGDSEPFFHTGTQALTDGLPNAQRRVLAGQTHEVSNVVLAPALKDFFQ